ncbi:unnamed protein product [Oppiella nova]|uniref:Uncharacterized protein n=1 Tax=Oppiella nova TaxID=334625 RepID=A0A7R9QA80_9ACAR|nr:unnamed protein product [Oppiella nova]CAG2161557.1 unnamed protein product [Oppiella nova]
MAYAMSSTAYESDWSSSASVSSTGQTLTSESTPHVISLWDQFNGSAVVAIGVSLVAVDERAVRVSVAVTKTCDTIHVSVSVGHNGGVDEVADEMMAEMSSRYHCDSQSTKKGVTHASQQPHVYAYETHPVWFMKSYEKCIGIRGDGVRETAQNKLIYCLRSRRTIHSTLLHEDFRDVSHITV